MSARAETKSSETQTSNGGGGRARNGSAASDNVDKIRELLFGQQMVDYEARFAALEAKLTAEAEALRKMVEDSLVELRAHSDKRSDEVEALSVPRRQIAEALEKMAEKLRG